MLLSCKIVLYAYFVGVAIFSCVVVVFFLLLNSKISDAFFCLFHFCNLHSVLVCVVHNYLCVWWHFFLRFDFVCVIPCLPYFLQRFREFLHSFLLPKCSLFCFLFFAGFSRCHFLVFFVFLAAQFASFCAVGYFWVLCYENLFLLCCYNFFLLPCFAICVIAFFDNLWPSLTHLCVLVLLFCLASPFRFLLFNLIKCIDCTIAPLTSPLFLPLILSTHHNHCCQYEAFFYLGHAPKNMSCSPIRGSFCLVFVPPREHTPHCTHTHPLSPICIHFVIIFGKTHITWCPGNFPRPCM